MKKNLFFMPLFVLSACVTAQEVPSSASNNDKSYEIGCHDLRGTRDQCLNEAEKLCKGDFEVVEKKSHKMEYADSGDGFYMPPKYLVTVLCNKT